MLNPQLAKAYLAGTDAEMPRRTWQHALEVVTETKRGANKERWKRAAKDRALSLLRPKVIAETEAELILKVLRIGTVSTERCVGVFASLGDETSICVARDLHSIPFWPLFG